MAEISSTDIEPTVGPRGRVWVRGAIGLLLLVGVVLGGRQLAGIIPGFTRWVESLGAIGPLVFVLGYAVAVVAFVPGALLTLAAGAVFGVVAGTGYVLLGATLGAAGAFLASRYLVRRAVERRLAGNARFAAVDAAIARDGRKVVFLLRLSPAFPFGLLNYALGLTSIRFGDYVVASLGMLPGTLLYTYSGMVAGDLATAASIQGPAHGAGYYAVIGLGLAATVLVTLVVTRVARRALTASTSTP